MDENEVRALWQREGLRSLESPSQALNFRTLSDLNYVIKRNLHLLHGRFDLIVGVPRSGLTPAVMIALHFNLPFLSLSEFLANRLFDHDFTTRRGTAHSNLHSANKKLRILIVDDSVNSGATFQKIKQMVRSVQNVDDFVIEYLAVFASSRSRGLVDFAFDLCEHPRIFEWNMMHHTMVETFMFDLDGIMCIDGPQENSDDGGAYENFISNVPAKVIPSGRIGAIVTSRLERHRKATEAWLSRNGVNYSQLIMMNLPSAERRRELGPYTQYKADVYKTLGGALFIESEEWQAKDIFRISKKPVFCLDTGLFLRT